MAICHALAVALIPAGTAYAAEPSANPWGVSEAATAAGAGALPGNPLPDTDRTPVASVSPQPWGAPVFDTVAPAQSTPASASLLTAFAGFTGGSDQQRAIDCMTAAIAYEAGNQPLAGQQAVGQVILNRVRDLRFPKSVCGVVFAGSQRVTGCQFTFTCDGSIRRRLSDTTMLAARVAAEQVLSGIAPDRVSGATHYHADYVLPYWAASGTPVARIGAHIFYRMPGGGKSRVPGAITLASADGEPDVAALAQVATRHGAPRGARGTRGRLAAARVPQANGQVHAMFTPWGLPVASAP